MASDYQAIREKHQTDYGIKVDSWGRTLLANRYADRTHFIYELLQNAEDALAKRDGWHGSRSVRFHLSERKLRFSHFGKPFDGDDVRGICGIAEGTKERDITQIGRFGIGFKSVYAFTDRPEVHSDTENFAIERFVWPVAVPPVDRAVEETQIILPLNAPQADREEITSGLQRLGPDALLFLREIEEIDWEVKDGPSGLYLRQSEEIGDNVRRITVVGQAEGKPDVEETWLIFCRTVRTPKNESAGQVEVAFCLNDGQVVPIPRSPLVVFFPTVVQTDLGFRVQGPYRTTPSRDNVPQRDKWNQYCVQETSEVLLNALVWLRERDMLDASVLQCLPLIREKFHQDALFYPFFKSTKWAFKTARLLPSFGGGYVTAEDAKLAGTQELRDLFGVQQLAQLFGGNRNLAWLTADISRGRTPRLRRYLMEELGILEVTPATILPKLDAKFMEMQSDEWVRKLYEFLNSQIALRRQTAALPIVRLENGQHVRANAGDQSQVFLPGTLETSFPTVRASVCDSERARAFLRSIGLTRPDPVDDIVLNVLPKYHGNAGEVTDDVYHADIARIIDVYQTDSKVQREKLIEALRRACFVRAVSPENQSRCYARPGDVYLSTERLKKLFAGIAGVKLVDDGCAALHGDAVRRLLEACGASTYLRPVKFDSISSFTDEELSGHRKNGGHEETSWRNDKIRDWQLVGLDAAIHALSNLPVKEQWTRVEAIWEELIRIEERRGKAVFAAKYTWTYYGNHNTEFDSQFVRLLNEREWVPDANGDLHRPALVPFETLGWRSNPFLASKICFKPPIVDQLAEEAGFEPKALDLLQKYGITSVDDVISRLRLDAPAGLEHRSDGLDTPDDAIRALLGDSPEPTPPVHDTGYPESHAAGGGTVRYRSGGRGGRSGGRPEGAISNNKSGNGGTRPFISYVATNSEDENYDPDGLEHAARIALEETAIDFILDLEPHWKRTSTGNVGFDLFAVGPDGSPKCWCEVKAMTGCLRDRPVGLSHRQFGWARKHGSQFWLYVVEHAGADNARLVRIQDPAGKARTFTFDHGWLSVARISPERERRSD